MDEFSKISLHNHFGGKTAERLLSEPPDKILEFDYKEACGKLLDAYRNGFSLLSLTNSNSLSCSLYYLLNYFAKKLDINLLPGLEMNIQNPNDAERFHHFVVNFNPEINLLEIEENVNRITLENGDNFFNVEQFVNILSNHKCVIIIHGLKQEKRSASENPETLIAAKEIDGIIPVIIEDNKPYHIETLKIRLTNILKDDDVEWLDNNSIVSCADRESFSSIDSPTLM